MPDKPCPTLPAPAQKTPRHGLYSWISSKKLPQGRTFQKVRRELGQVREDLIDHHGGEKISPDQLILVDSVVEALGVQKLLGLYVRKYGVVDGQAAKRGRLELSPILAKNWISYGNMVRQGILALKEMDGHKPPEQPLTIEALAAEVEREDAEREASAQPAADGPGSAHAGRSAEGGGDATAGEGVDSGDSGREDEKRGHRIDGERRARGDEAKDQGVGIDNPEGEGS
jgi:hypothetical protein